LADSGGVISEMARRLGCSRKQVYRYLEQHGLSLSDYRSG
jgi:transcriptional regulator of acetoin/glycerol metabolism